MVLLSQFGFREEGSKGRDAILVKRLRPDAATSALPPLERYIRHGPGYLDLRDDHVWLVPIQPVFHEMLFPSPVQQLTLGLALAAPYGNALRKAYVSSSRVRSLEPGDVLLFYRSDDLQAVTTVGVVDDVGSFTEIELLTRFVSRRTVYSSADLEARLTNGPALAILFRYDRTLSRRISLVDLIQNRVATAAPQSFTKARQEGLPWLRQRIGA